MTLSPSTWLQKFRFEPITTGFFKGHYALQGTLSPTSTNGTPEHRLGIIEAALNSPAAKLRRKVFRLTIEGLLPPEDIDRAISFLETFAKFGWNIHLVFDGFTLPDGIGVSLLRGAAWVVVKTSSAIVSYAGNEYWYLPKPGEALRDPTFPVQPSTVLYLLTKDLDEIEVLDFLGRSKFDWNVLL